MTNEHSVNCKCCPNPIVRETPLRAYPGWVVRKYRDGMYDATNGIALTGGSPHFSEVVAMVRDDQKETVR